MALDGKVRLYLDQASSGIPEFTAESLIQDGASDLTVASGRSSVEVVDLNKDGRKDLVLGNTEGQLFFYANVGTDIAPVFAGAEAIAVDGLSVNLPGTPRSRPFVGSFQADGPPDVWVGEESGVIRHYAVTSWPGPSDVPAQDGPAGGTFVFRFEAQASPWQNPADHLDVSGDGLVVPGDVLLIINELNAPTCHDAVGKLQPPAQAATVPWYYDTNGDGYCTPIDALLVINWLNSPAGAGEGRSRERHLGWLDLVR